MFCPGALAQMRSVVDQEAVFFLQLHSSRLLHHGSCGGWASEHVAHLRELFDEGWKPRVMRALRGGPDCRGHDRGAAPDSGGSHVVTNTVANAAGRSPSTVSQFRSMPCFFTSIGWLPLPPSLSPCRARPTLANFYSGQLQKSVVCQVLFWPILVFGQKWGKMQHGVRAYN